jgi:putative flippase GtrA
MKTDSGALVPPERLPVATSRLSALLETLLLASRTGVAVQFVRYLLVGGTAFAADFATLAVLKESGLLGVLPAAAVAFAVGTLVNYAISMRWVFTDRAERALRVEFALFCAVGVVGLGLNHLLIWGLVSLLSVHYLAAKILSTGTVLGWNFFARRFALSKE